MANTEISVYIVIYIHIYIHIYIYIYIYIQNPLSISDFIMSYTLIILKIIEHRFWMNKISILIWLQWL